MSSLFALASCPAQAVRVLNRGLPHASHVHALTHQSTLGVSQEKIPPAPPPLRHAHRLAAFYAIQNAAPRSLPDTGLRAIHVRFSSTDRGFSPDPLRYPVASFDLSQVLLQIPHPQNLDFVTRFPIIKLSDSDLKEYMLTLPRETFANRNALPPLDEMTMTHSTHSKERMFVGFKLSPHSNGTPDFHRYTLKILPTDQLGPASADLLKREVLSAYVMWLLNQPYSAKIKGFQLDTATYCSSRRYLNGSPVTDYMASLSTLPESLIPTQDIVNLFIIHTLIYCSTEFANPGNDLILLNPDGSRRSKVKNDAAIVRIDTERDFPDATLITYIKDLLFKFREARGDFSREIPTHSFSRCWFDWVPGMVYPASPAWRRQVTRELGPDVMMDTVLNGCDPSMLFISDRLSRNEIPPPDRLFVSPDLQNRVLQNHAFIRGVLIQFGLYPKGEIHSENLPFNQGYEIFKQRAEEGKLVSLRDAMIGGLDLFPDS